MKKVIVTGANGFVGSWLVMELSKQGTIVFAIVKDQSEDISRISNIQNIHIIFCDLENLKNLPDMIQERGFDAFYHLAWVAAGGKNRADYNIQLTNVGYCCDAVKVANKLDCRAILFSGTISERLINDSWEKKTQVAANEIYAICKKFAHYLVSAQGKINNIRTIWMQFANLYGPYSINGNIVGYTLNQLLNKEEALFGPADQMYDLLYIEDLVKAAVLLGMSDKAEGTFYIGSGQPKELKEYLMSIGEICGNPELIKIGNRPDDGTKYEANWFSIDKLTSITGYIPHFSFKDSINKTKEWLSQQQF